MKSFKAIIILLLLSTLTLQGCSKTLSQKDLLIINKACNDHEGIYEVQITSISILITAYCKDGAMEVWELNND